MSRYQGQPDFQHGREESIGVLIANLGTPDAPDAKSLRRYLREFLSDPRVVEVPRPIWWLILNLVILNVRPRKSAKAYQTVWTPEGSPLLVNSERQQRALSDKLSQAVDVPIRVALGMRYGSPSIASALDALERDGARRIFVLPLYPQYSGSTTASVFDAVFDHFKRKRWVPDIRTLSSYYEDAGYVEALAQSIRRHVDAKGMPERLLFSFHGIPERYFRSGDPYHCHCHATAERVATALGLSADAWTVTFQSRFGREQWLTPYTDETLRSLPKQGVRHVAVVCPGFASDCIETIEEIDEENRHYFMEAGGDRFEYIPCLNDDDAHIQALAAIVQTHTADWQALLATATSASRQATLARARKVGATK